jgi:polysaccharide chain length determinant protein (PEP-CTERM system associated)
MTPLIEQILDDVRSSWRFRWPALALAFVISIAGWLAVFALPDQYEAYARVFVDQRTALKPVLQGLAVDQQDVGAELNYVRQSLLAGPEMEKIATQSGVLAASVANDKMKTQILRDMVNRIVLTVRSASDREEDRNTAGQIYSIGYKDGNRARALRVVQILVNTFVEETLGGKLESSATAQKFLESQLKDYEQRLRAAENRLADFKKRNVGLMPNDGASYFQQLQTEYDAVQKSKTSLDTALARRAELSKQLHGDTAITAVASAPASVVGGAASGGDTVARISEAQARLDELLLKFTDKHPDVIAARQTLEDLKKRRAAEIEGLRKGDPNAAAATRASINPVYQSLQLGINQADVEIAALRSELAQHQDRMAELRQRLNSAPQVEAEYAQLNRDYDVNKAQYAALLGNFQKAQLGAEADKAGSVRFEIVQPPTAGFQPVSANRSLLIGVVLLGSMVLGGALAYGLHWLRPVVMSVKGLENGAGVRVLGTVGPAFPQRSQRLERREKWSFSAATACLLVLFVTTLVLNWAGVRLTAQLLKNMVGA